MLVSPGSLVILFKQRRPHRELRSVEFSRDLWIVPICERLDTVPAEENCADGWALHPLALTRRYPQEEQAPPQLLPAAHVPAAACSLNKKGDRPVSNPNPYPLSKVQQRQASLHPSGQTTYLGQPGHPDTNLLRELSP